MHAGVAAGVVDEHLAIGVGYPTIGEGHVHNVANIFLTLGNKEVAARLGYYPGGVVEGSHIQIEDIAQTRGAAPDAMGEMEPSAGCFYGMGTLAVLYLHYGVIVAAVYYGLLLYLGMGYVVDKSPPDATARAGVDEAILGTGVEGILSIDKLRVEHYVALLTLCLEVGQTLPVDEVLGAGYGCRRRGGRKVAGTTVVVALSTEHSVDPTVLVGCKAHVIDVGGGDDVLGHCDGLFPKTEIVNSVGALSYGEETLAVGSLHTHYEEVFAMPLYGAAVQGGVHHYALH